MIYFCQYLRSTFSMYSICQILEREEFSVNPAANIVAFFNGLQRQIIVWAAGKQ